MSDLEAITKCVAALVSAFWAFAAMNEWRKNRIQIAIFFALLCLICVTIAK